MSRRIGANMVGVRIEKLNDEAAPEVGLRPSSMK
jgi:hypothetical protein